jgi:hypothetical protein
MATTATTRSHRLITLAILAGLVVAACTPGGSTPPPEATSAFVEIPSAASPAPLMTATPLPTFVPTPTVTASPAPTPTTAPTASQVPQLAEADPQPFAMNLASKGDFVPQHTFEWCVGASLQMAWNITTGERRASRSDQGALWAMARDRSSSPFGGANPRGWTATLNDLGIGPYRLVSLPTLREALMTAAAAIRATDRPVGLVMWRGRHAWVMSGFEATADPRTFDDFRVTGIHVHDPLYPHGSEVWGASPKPNTLISPKVLAKQFVLRDSTRVNVGVGPGWLLVLPVTDAA